MDTINKIDKLIANKQRNIELLEELKELKIMLTKVYHFIDHGMRRYSLIKLDSEDIVCHGPITRLKAYIRLRNIKLNTIYKWPKHHTLEK